MGWANYTEWKRDKERREAARREPGAAVLDLSEHRARLEEADRVIAASRAQRARERALFQGGGGLALTTVGADGRPVKDGLPVWTEYIRREQEAGRLPATNVVQRAREAGDPVRDWADYRRKKLIYGGGDAA